MTDDERAALRRLWGRAERATEAELEQAPEDWAAEQLGRPANQVEVRRAALGLRRRRAALAPKPPAKVAPALPAPRGEPPRTRCDRCGTARPSTWSGRAWQLPAACDGHECGFIGRLPTPAPPTIPELQRALDSLRQEAWAFRHVLPSLAAEATATLGALDLAVSVLEAIRDGAEDPAGLAAEALQLREPIEPVRLRPWQPTFDMAELEDDEVLLEEERQAWIADQRREIEAHEERVRSFPLPAKTGQ
jgi:hypothetical protein